MTPTAPPDGKTRFADDATLAYIRELELALSQEREDARRYRWIRDHVGGMRDMLGKHRFHLPSIMPIGDIMHGSVAQHFDAAIDSALQSRREGEA